MAEGSCPSCGKQFDTLGSLKVAGRDAMTDDDGVVSKDGETDLILSDPDPKTVCGYCGSEVMVEAHEEIG